MEGIKINSLVEGILVLILLNMVLLKTVVGQASTEKKITTLEIHNNEFNHGVVPADTILKTNFIIFNTGKIILEIEEVTTSCNCTKYEMSKSRIQPLDSCTFTMIMNTKDKKGNVKYSAMIKTNTYERFYILNSYSTVTY